MSPQYSTPSLPRAARWRSYTLLFSAQLLLACGGDDDSQIGDESSAGESGDETTAANPDTGDSATGHGDSSTSDNSGDTGSTSEDWPMDMDITFDGSFVRDCEPIIDDPYSYGTDIYGGMINVGLGWMTPQIFHVQWDSASPKPAATMAIDEPFSRWLDMPIVIWATSERQEAPDTHKMYLPTGNMGHITWNEDVGANPVGQRFSGDLSVELHEVEIDWEGNLDTQVVEGGCKGVLNMRWRGTVLPEG